MLPVGDDNRDRLRRPVVATIFIALNVALFLYELLLQSRGGPALGRFLSAWGVIPVEFAQGRDLPPENGVSHWATLVTSMFLHGGWGHIIGNMLYLWVFGDNVEDRLGRVPFVVFYLVAGIAGSAAQILAAPSSPVPTIGASGAISGVLGAYVLMFPRKRVRVLAFYFLFEVPAVLVIGLWAATQLVYGAGSLAARSTQAGGVAYLAHVGGFAAGILVALLWRLAFGRPRVRL